MEITQQLLTGYPCAHGEKGHRLHVNIKYYNNNKETTAELTGNFNLASTLFYTDPYWISKKSDESLHGKNQGKGNSSSY